MQIKKVIVFIAMVLGAFILAACNSGVETNLSDQPFVAVSAVGAKSQGFVELFSSTDPGTPIQANLATPGYPLGGQWSPDGKYFAFILIKSPSDTDIYRLDWVNKQITRITNTPECPEIGLRWAANSSLIYFSVFCPQNGPVTEFFHVTLDGSKLTKLGQVDYAAEWAVYSPNLNYVSLISSVKSDSTEISVAGVDGSNLTLLSIAVSNGFENQSSSILDWSSDGNYVVFATSPFTVGVSSANQIIVSRFDGSERRVLVQPPAGIQCYFPRWSPDNTRIAFVCGPDLMVIRLDGSGLENLTDGTGGMLSEFPTWTGNNQGLLYLAKSGAGMRTLQRIQINNRESVEIGTIEAGLFYGIALQPLATLDASGDSVIPANSSPSQSTDYSNSYIPWLIFIWLGVMVLVAAVFILRKIPSSFQGVEKLLTSMQNSSRKERLAKRAERRAAVDSKIKQEPAAQTFSSSTSASSDQKNSSQFRLRNNEEGGILPNDMQNTSELLEIGIRQARTGDADGAIENLKNYLAEFPFDSNAWLWMGFAAGQKLDWRTAESCFRRAGKLGNPQFMEALDWLEEHKKLME